MDPNINNQYVRVLNFNRCQNIEEEDYEEEDIEGAENEEDEDIEENNEGTAPDDEGAQVIVDLRNNKGGMSTQ